MKIIFALIALTNLPNIVFADINFITPPDLPKTAQRTYFAHGRGDLPDFDESYAIKKAMSSTDAELDCMAKTGKQLTPWKTQEGYIGGNYWTYTLSADFECQPPTVSANISGDFANRLFDDLRGLSIATSNGFQKKKASVLCYQSFETVCSNNVPLKDRDLYICELGDLNNGGTPSQLEDILELGVVSETVIQDQGARKLQSDLPVYLDYRRDDGFSDTCAPHAWGKLKGITRQAAIITCSQNAERAATICQIDGMIDTSKVAN